jgi:predicted DCC family thiol-disulfide oxidoreductase YuxK
MHENRKDKNELSSSIVFYDGNCGMCNYFVRWTLHRDIKKNFLFSHLQSRYAAQILPESLTKNFSTIVVRTNTGKIITHSSAVIYICQKLGGVWKLAALLFLIPPPIRDVVYKIVARYRHKFFPPPNTCRLLREEEKKRFVD